MWLPHGWWIEVEGRIKHFAFYAGVENLVKIESPAKFRSAKAASKAAENALRLMAYEIRDVGWTKFRCHSLHNYETPPCGNCYRILESIPYPENPEADVKKHFRYVSFNSERIPVGLQRALEKLKGESHG